MKMRLFLLCTAFIGCALPRTDGSEGAPAHAARTAVAQAFERWVRAEGTPFDLLAEDATWTILGPTPSAGTYTLTELREKILAPFNARLATPLVPVLRSIHADGDTVIVCFDARAQLKSGDPYTNSYAWFFRFENGRVRNVTAVLDVSSFDRVLATSPKGE